MYLKIQVTMAVIRTKFRHKYTYIFYHQFEFLSILPWKERSTFVSTEEIAVNISYPIKLQIKLGGHSNENNTQSA